ncbi:MULTISPECIES: DUF1304 domain-containing protein [unclassified Vibrio]|uniref:DUF1304 domain-containing protein n=1 Tax=unclassified Vibrio TaxID=2614977 RepID=UPI001361722F|nr:MULTISPECIES: DUF1304 domain-containing protein [unclassified Vibrio]NAW58051.1 DUF1304 family protein [Vibrio sp. V36_P2S2PM302]NAX26299.1 DUF1304 family protein [Vibrio sp. V38_P2S17PM301]NAX31872.1 DUF1304 family protein [Vibrio sp. V37_P2S8PM304]
MSYIATALVLFVALEHAYILILEMFLWQSPKTRKVFATSEEFAASTKVLAANQGLYNGFLCAGLIWGLTYPDTEVGTSIQMFFLSCVICAAIFGGLSANTRILFVQGGPAVLAVLATMFS